MGRRERDTRSRDLGGAQGGVEPDDHSTSLQDET